MNKVIQEEKKNKAFSEPAIEVVRFDAKDVITTSKTDAGLPDIFSLRKH